MGGSSAHLRTLPMMPGTMALDTEEAGRGGLACSVSEPPCWLPVLTPSRWAQVCATSHLTPSFQCGCRDR